MVELVTLASGRRVVVKSRNDRETCRETLFYRSVLSCAGIGGKLVPAYLGSGTTAGGVHVLVLEYIAGRQVDWRNDDERGLALHALADFHARFEGRTLAEVFPALAAPPLLGEAVPDPQATLVTTESVTTTDPLVLDPGDVRPENFVLASDPASKRGGRVILVDFEKAGVRRRSVALATMLRNCPPGGDPLADYAQMAHHVSRFPLRSMAFPAAIGGRMRTCCRGCRLSCRKRDDRGA
jgi:hypothetical protein